MKKDKQVSAIAQRTRLPKVQVERVLDEFASLVASELLQGNEITLRGIGKFTPVLRSARTIENCAIAGGSTVDIPEQTAVRFSASTTLRKTLN